MKINYKQIIVFLQRLILLYCLSILSSLSYAASNFSPAIAITESQVSNTTSIIDERGRITTIAPGFSYENTQNRSQFLVDYALNIKRYNSLSTDDTENSDLSMLYAVTHIPEHWITRVTGNVQQSSISSEGIQSFNNSLITANTQELTTYGVSTQFDTKFKQTVNLKTLLLADYADYEDSENTDSVGFDVSLDNQASQRKLFWNTELGSRQSNSGSTSEELSTFRLGLNYRFSRQYTGYANTRIEDSSNEDLNETTTMVGLNWQPDKNSTINAGIGVRGSDATYSLNTRFIKRRLTLSINYNEDITSSRNEVLKQTSDETGIINTYRSLSITPVFQKKAAINLIFTGRRSSVSTSYSSQTRSTGSSVDEEIEALSLSLSRKLSAKSSISFKYQVQNSKTSEQNDVTDLQLTYNRSLSRNMKLMAELSNSKQESDVLQNEYEQSLLGVTISMVF